MKKGFTLIELLAVIVILAVIAIIATPIIINIIEDASKNSAKSSAELYAKGLSKQIAAKNMTGAFDPTSCTVLDGSVTCDGVALEYNVNGRKPTSGTITFNNGIVTGYTLVFTDYTVVKDQNGVSVTNGASTPIQTTYTAYTMGQLLQYDPVNNTSCTTGDTCYKWRVITVGDATSNSTITLQMDHNLVNLSAWVSKADYNDNANFGSGNNNKGPITALKALETATSTWDDSLKLNYTYDTSSATNNYGTLSCTNGTCTVAGSQITSNLKARMITGEEVRTLTLAAGAAEGTTAYTWTLASSNGYYFSRTNYVLGTTTAVASGSTGNTILSWLVENTDVYANSGATDNTYGATNYGYWTLSTTAEYSHGAWGVDSYGGLAFNSVSNGSDYGIRPVITIQKSVLN